jgi:hypothetical protein
VHSPLVKVVHPSLFGALCASKNRTHKLWGLMYSHSLLWPSWCVWKYKNVPRSQKIDCAHMSYFVRRHCPYFVHFVRLKIKRTNLWGLDITHLGSPHLAKVFPPPKKICQIFLFSQKKKVKNKIILIAMLLHIVQASSQDIKWF